MVALLLLQMVYGWSVRQAMENTRFDDQVKFTLRVRRTPENPRESLHRCKCRAQALTRDLGHHRLRETLQEARAAGLLGDEDRIENFMMAGAAARQETRMLIVCVMRRCDDWGRKKLATDWGNEAEREA
ncbi:MAG: hypothetical protein OWU84_10935 [Firmicutes bacterium]|nr:hypothetical protein [Bacillota bacterium]